MKNLLRENFTAIFVAILFCTGLLSLACGGGKGPTTNGIPSEFEVNHRYQNVKNFRLSPKGVVVGGESVPTDVQLAEIDKGLDELFVKNEKVGYNKRPETVRKHGDVKIYLLDGILDQSGTPVIEVVAPNYKGTGFDHPCTKNSKLTCVNAAEYFLGCGFWTDRQAFANEWIVAAHGDDIGSIANATLYGGEHCTLQYEDGEKFLATRTHTGNSGHPLY